MSTVRLRRLTADFAKLSDYVRRHPRVRLIQSEGDPPERYQLEYRINSVRKVNDEMQLVKTHLVEIFLPRNYPRTPPQCRMLSPVFHPNIAPHAICVGDHWSSGEPLQSIVMRIGELLAYQSYNVKSPLNGEAARWVEKNESKMPLDKVSLLAADEDSQSDSQQVAHTPANPSPPASPPVSPSRPASPPKPPRKTEAVSQEATYDIACPTCQKTYRLSRNLLGKRVKCTNCNQSFTIPSESQDASA